MIPICQKAKQTKNVPKYLHLIIRKKYQIYFFLVDIGEFWKQTDFKPRVNNITAYI